mmetsp:Transcript_24325/g.38976  ORF Transcript_24325/g.38976 Transcript_24325/m.38976 type:complete len:203 (+) Transcript_24325:312-920(+)
MDTADAILQLSRSKPFASCNENWGTLSAITSKSRIRLNATGSKGRSSSSSGLSDAGEELDFSWSSELTFVVFSKSSRALIFSPSLLFSSSSASLFSSSSGLFRSWSLTSCSHLFADPHRNPLSGSRRNPALILPNGNTRIAYRTRPTIHHITPAQNSNIVRSVRMRIAGPKYIRIGFRLSHDIYGKIVNAMDAQLRKKSTRL